MGLAAMEALKVDMGDDAMKDALEKAMAAMNKLKGKMEEASKPTDPPPSKDRKKASEKDDDAKEKSKRSESEDNEKEKKSKVKESEKAKEKKSSQKGKDKEADKAKDKKSSKQKADDKKKKREDSDSYSGDGGASSDHSRRKHRAKKDT